jgi:hypothetical protein
MSHCWSVERAHALLDLAQAANMNVFRVWGEGYIPPRGFYDECDRRGILVWQDFMFGYGMHPESDADWLADSGAEIADTVRRLRNHTCVFLWCGGNENHMGWDFAQGDAGTPGETLFDEVMPEACSRLDPARPFHRSSPYGGSPPNWPLSGDWHDYTTLKACPQASVPLYASEIGRVSAPCPASMERFLSDGELWPAEHDPAIRTPGQAAWPDMWQYRSVDGAWDKVAALEEFCDPRSAEDLIRVLGTAHGEYLQRRVERHRRGTPDGGPAGNRRCWGTTIWRLNDPWPIIYWSAIDYYLIPKIPYYFVRRAYAPVLVCFERTADRISVWVVNDSPRAATGRLQARRRRFDGATTGQLETDVALGPGQAGRCLDLTPMGPVLLREEFLQATFTDQSATMLLTGERYLHLPRVNLMVRRTDTGVEVVADGFARQVAIRGKTSEPLACEDNFFDLPPAEVKSVRLPRAVDPDTVTIGAANAYESVPGQT